MCNNTFRSNAEILHESISWQRYVSFVLMCVFRHPVVNYSRDVTAPVYFANDTKQSDEKKLCQRVIRKQLSFSMNVEIKHEST